MLGLRIENTAAVERAITTMLSRLDRFAGTEMPQVFFQWQSQDMKRSRPEVEQKRDAVETTIKDTPRVRYRWWEEQPREPSGIPEGGEWLEFPFRRRRRRRRRRARRPRQARRPRTVGAVAAQRVRARITRRLRRRFVAPTALRRLRRVVAPRKALIQRRLRRAAGITTARMVRRRVGIRPLRPALGERLANRMTRAMTEKITWR